MQEHESPCSKLEVLKEGVENFKDECSRDFARLENADRTLEGDMNGMSKDFRQRFDKITALQFTLLGGVILSLLGIVFNIVTKK